MHGIGRCGIGEVVGWLILGEKTLESFFGIISEQDGLVAQIAVVEC